jgi:hypothetical protein
MMTTFTDNVAKLNDFQSQGLEPARKFTGIAVEAFEQIARQNYAVCGDMLEFAVSQAKLPMDVTDPKALFERQAESTKALAELLTARAEEYAAIGKTIQDTTTQLVNKDIVEPAKKAAKKAA